MGAIKFAKRILLAIYVLALSAGMARTHPQRVYNTQNIQTLLNSLDERLRALDKSSTYRYLKDMDVHMQKLETLEGRIERFESMISARLDNIEGNMSVQHFKDHLVQDQLVRKIDAISERIYQKMLQIEMKIDTNERKATEKFEFIFKKVEHFEETANRRSEADEDVAEVFDILDEMKSSLHAGIENVTQVMHLKLAKLENKLAPKPLLENIANLESIANASRYEQQNAMRSLVVLVGRLGNKHNNNQFDNNSNYSGSSVHQAINQQLLDVSRKIDARFNSIMEQQTEFLDSCHRIQSDEPQLESKISEILEKIIDLFEKGSAVEIKDIQNLEQLINRHDASVRRSLYTTSHNMGVLLQKTKEHNDELEKQIAALHTSVDGITSISFDLKAGNNKLLNDLRTHPERDAANKQAQVQQQLIDRLEEFISSFISNVTVQGSVDKNNLHITGDVKNLSVKIDVVLERLKSIDNFLLDAAIREIWINSVSNTTYTVPGDINAPNSTHHNEITFEDISGNCTSNILDVRHATGSNVQNCTICATSNERIVTCCCPTQVQEHPHGKLPSTDDEFQIDIRAKQNDTTLNAGTETTMGPTSVHAISTTNTQLLHGSNVNNIELEDKVFKT